MKKWYLRAISLLAIMVMMLCFLSCDLFSGRKPSSNDNEEESTTVDISTLSKCISHLPEPANLMSLDTESDKSLSKAVYSDPSPQIPTGFMLANYMANGGFYAIPAIFYAEALAGLKILGDAPKDTVLDMTNTSEFFNVWFSTYTQKAIWTTTEKKNIIKVTFISTATNYLINTLIEIQPDTEHADKCLIYIGIHLEIGTQKGNCIADYSETTKCFKGYIDLGDTGGGHAYMISMKNADDSVLFGMMNDPYAYFYGYKDVNGSVISGYNLNSNNLEGSEYTNAAGAYQNADEMNGTSIPLYCFQEIPGTKIGFEAQDGGAVWVDTNEDGVKDATEETIPGNAKSTWFLTYYDAGYYYGTSSYIPCININAIPSTHSLYGKFIYKSGYEVAQKSYLDSKLESIKTNLSLSYNKGDYDTRITALEAETFPE